MASNHTTHYELCQWEAEDNFVRTEFNADNLKVDAAIRKAEEKADRALSGLVPVSYNVYNLLLRDYYEKRFTGFKRALIFDGFLDEEQIESTTAGMAVSKAGHFLFQDFSANENQNVNFGSQMTSTLSAGQSLTETWVADRLGWSFAVRLQMSGSATLTMTAKSTGVQKTFDKASLGSGVEEVAFPFGAELDPGETYIFQLTARTTVVVGRASGLTGFGYQVQVIPVSTEQGVLISKPYSLDSSFSQARAWVRHSVCQTPEMSIWDAEAETWLPMVPIGNRSAHNLLGKACNETSYTLPEVPDDTRILKLRMEVTQYPGFSFLPLYIYDYGIAAL